MTGIGKLLVFLNLIAAAALLTWGLSAYANSPNWVDSKSADGTAVEGEISLLKKEIDKFAKAGSVPLGSTPAELRARYQHWMGIFEKIAKDAGVKPQ